MARRRTGGRGAVERHVPLKPVWFQVLLTLAGGVRHGYAIRQEVEERTEGAIRLWPTTLYGTLSRLESEGLIVEADGDGPADDVPRRFWGLTSLGRRVLSLETDRLAALVRESRSRQSTRAREA